jgi:hypothetical protein
VLLLLVRRPREERERRLSGAEGRVEARVLRWEEDVSCCGCVVFEGEDGVEEDEEKDALMREKRDILRSRVGEGMIRLGRRAGRR